MIMKSIVLDMMKYSLFFLFAFCCITVVSSQNKYEREHRIRKSQFPEKALAYVQEKLIDARRIRFYKEIDSAQVNYEVKFKKDRLWYGIVFGEKGTLEIIEFIIQPLDVPEDTFEKINNYLKQHFTKHKVKRLQQQYIITPQEDEKTTVKNAFQNLILPTIIYKLTISGKNGNNFEQYKVRFDAEGNLKSIKKSPPPNYDRVLY